MHMHSDMSHGYAPVAFASCARATRCEPMRHALGGPRQNASVAPDECDCQWATTVACDAAMGRSARTDTCSVACCGVYSKAPATVKAPLLCSPFVYARSIDGHAAATIFAMRHDASSNTSTLYYALDNTSSGVHGLWTDAKLRQRATRAPAKMSPLLPPSHVFANDGSRVTSLPEVRVCGSLARRARRPRCHVSISLMCRLRFEQVDATCVVILSWPGMGLNVSADLCTPRGSLPRVLVAVATPVFLPPTAAAQSATLQLLADWAPRIALQVGRVYVHAINGGGRVRRKLQAQVPALLERRRVRVVSWDWYEAAGMALRPDSNLIAPASTAEQRHGRQFDVSSNPLLGMNPYHTQMWVLTKSLLELQDAAEWVLLIDFDERWPTRLRNHRVPLMVQQVLQSYPDFVQQHPFCAMQGCAEGNITWRPKSAIRISTGKCEWWGHPHAGVSVDQAGVDENKPLGWVCDPKDDYGNPVDVFSNTASRLWAKFAAKCRPGGKNRGAASGGLGLTAGNYFEHTRLEGGQVSRCTMNVPYGTVSTTDATHVSSADAHGVASGAGGAGAGLAEATRKRGAVKKPTSWLGLGLGLGLGLQELMLRLGLKRL